MHGWVLNLSHDSRDPSLMSQDSRLSVMQGHDERERQVESPFSISSATFRSTNLVKAMIS